MAQSYATSYTSFFIQRYLPNLTVTPNPLTTRFPSIFLGSQYSAGAGVGHQTGMSFANCTLEPAFVESVVECKGTACGVTRMRKAAAYSNTSYFWNSDLMNSENTEYFDMFSQEIAFAIPGYYQSNFESTPTEVYLNGNESYSFASNGDGQVSLYKFVSPGSKARFLYLLLLDRVPIDDLARRFATITNTYWQASMAAGMFWTGQFWDAPIKDVVCAVNNCSGTAAGTVYDGIYPQSTTANVTHTIDIYKCHAWWLVLLVVASTLLFIIGLAGAVLRWKTRTPDILGYASSLTRDNPYVPARAVSSALDGLEDTKTLGALKIRLADVHPNEEYGHIAVTSVDNESDNRYGRLRRGRLYI